MVYAIAIPAAMILILHEAAVHFAWPLWALATAAISFLLLALLTFVLTDDRGIVVVLTVAAYQVVLYVVHRYFFKRVEKRELQAALWNASLDRKYYVDWYWWVSWVVLAIVVPTIVAS